MSLLQQALLRKKLEQGFAALATQTVEVLTPAKTPSSTPNESKLVYPASGPRYPSSNQPLGHEDRIKAGLQGVQPAWRVYMRPCPGVVPGETRVRVEGVVCAVRAVEPWMGVYQALVVEQV